MTPTEYLNQCRRLIAAHGHMVQTVFGETTTPPFAYTIGRTAVGQPELIVVGVTFDVAHDLLNDLVRIAAAGEPLTPGTEQRDLLADDVPVTIIAVHPEVVTDRMRIARAIYPDATIQALQVVYPDTAGRYPWQAGYDLDPRVQPLLGPSPTDQPRIDGGRSC